MALKRFKRCSDPLTEVEKFTKMKDKLENFIDKHEENAASFSKYLLESKLLDNEKLDVSEMKDLLEMRKNFRLDCDDKSEKLSSQNLREIEALTDIHVLTCEDKLDEVVEGSSNCVKTWTVEIHPDKNSFPDVVLTQQFSTLENPSSVELPEIIQLKVGISGIDSDDLGEVVKYCESSLEPQMITRLVREYLPLNHRRQDIFRNINNSKYCTLRSGNMVEFINSAGCVLAHVCFIISFDKRCLGWESSWMCKLTDAGNSACNSLNLPSELIKSGTVSTWDWDKVVETLAKVARLDTDTPVKEMPGACDFSNLEINTPTTGEELRKKFPKRKLN